MVDLTRFIELQKIQDEGKFFPILDAVGSLTDLKVKIAGPDSEVQDKAQREINKRIAEGRRVGVETSEEAFKEMAIDKLVASVLAWENLEYQGKPMECTPENVRQMLTDYPVFQQQVTFYASERSLYGPQADANPASQADAPKAKTGRNKG